MKNIIHFSAALSKYFMEQGASMVAEEIARFTVEFIGEDNFKKIEEEVNPKSWQG